MGVGMVDFVFVQGCPVPLAHFREGLPEYLADSGGHDLASVFGDQNYVGM